MSAISDALGPTPPRPPMDKSKRIGEVYDDGAVVFYLNGGITLEVTRYESENAIKIRPLRGGRLVIRPGENGAIFVTGE